MFLLALRNLRARMGRTLFTASAIALGVALVFATRIVSVAAEGQAAAARESKLAGADLEVSPALAQFFPVALADKVLANPAVEKIAPVYNHSLTESQLELLGVDPARVLTPYELIAGEFFSDLPGLQDPAGLNGEILLPDIWAAQHGLGVGQTVRLTIADEPYEFKVAGLLKATPFGAATAWVPLSTLQTALRTPDAVSSILVRLKQGETPNVVKGALAEALGTAYVVTTAQDSTLADDALVGLTRIAFPFASVVVLLAGAYLVYNAFALTLTERKREIGQLRALGMTRGQVLAQTLTEALLMAGAGSLTGLPIGLGLAVVLVRSANGAEDAANAGSGAGQIQLARVAGVAIPLDGAVLAVGLGLLITFVATFALAWQAGRVSPLTALMVESSDTDTPAGRLYEKWGWVGALGLAVLFGVTNAAVAAYLRQGGSGDNGILYTLLPLLIPPFIVLLVIPAVMRGGLWLVERAFPRAVAARLAVGNIHKQKARALLTSASFAISLMLVVAFAGIALGFSVYSTNTAAPIFAADFMLMRPVPPGGVWLPVPPGLEADLAALRSEAQVLDYSVTNLPGYAIGPTAFVLSLDYLRAHPQAMRPIEGSLDEAERYIAAGPSLFLPEIAARRHNLHVGDTTLIGTLEGPVTFTVALIQTGYTIIPSDYGPRYFGAHPGFFMVSVAPGHDPTELADRLTALAQKHALQLVDDPVQWLSDATGQIYGAVLGLFAGLTSIAGIVAGLNLVNLLVASVLERQRELGTLRALGLTQAQVRALVVAEAGLLGLVGSLLGVLGALVISWANAQLFAAWLEAFFGPSTEAPALPWAVAGLTLILGPGIAMLAALWPADRAASVNPADAMRAEGATGFLPPAKHLGPTGLRGLIARLPLAAQLSIIIGVIFVLTLALTTYVRVNYERRLLTDNMRAILQRGFDLLNVSTRDAFSADVTELTPERLTQLQRDANLSVESLTASQASDSPYEFSLKYLFVTDPVHKVLLSDHMEFSGKTLTDTVTVNGSAALVRETNWLGVHAFEVVMPIENKAGVRLGLARIGLSAEPVDNVIRDIQRSSVWTALAALAVAVTLTVFFTRRALTPVSQVVEASRAVARGDLARRVPETRWDDVGQLNRAFNEMVSGLNDRERMRDLFGRYLSREVGEAVLAGRVSLKGERKTVTVLYCDMRGSTAFAEAHAPEDVMAALNQYFEVIILATEAHGGIVNRFVGDEAVCVFGAPTEYRDHAERAVQAALAVREGLAYVNQKRTALDQATLKFGMGLNTGEVTAGATGSEERQEYTVIGDAMNTGARIQGLTKNFPEHDILLSEFTHAALGPKAEAYALAYLGPVEIRGKTQWVRVFGLVRSKT